MITAFFILLFLLQEATSPEVPAIEPMRTFSGEAPDDSFGDMLSLIGDIDQDGYIDFAVGSSGQPGENGPLAGAVYLYSGTDARLLGVLRGSTSFGRFGKAVTYGDLTGNGSIEIIVGAPYFSSSKNEECGAIYVYSYPDCKLIVEIPGESDYERFGHALYCMDINGDGYEDILTGAPGARGRAGGGCGAVYAFSGNNGKRIKTLEGASPGDWFGYGLTCMDLNQDGFSDLVVSAPGFDSAKSEDTGRVYAYSGHDDSLLYSLDPNALTGVPGSSENENAGADRFGIRIQPLEDLNNDGSLEFMVTSLKGLFADAGVFDGATGRFLYHLASDEEIPDQGHPTVCMGDCNNDRIPDLVRGRSRDGQGLLEIYSGVDGRLLTRIPCASEVGAFGHALCEPLDGEYTGYPRIVVSGKTPQDPANETKGFAHLYQLSPVGVLCRYRSVPANPGFGTVVRIMGDINGDKEPELLVGCPTARGAKGKGAGKVYLYSSSGGGALQSFEGQSAGSFFGSVMAEAGDLDRDGLDDLIISAPGYQAGEAKNAGRLYFYSTQAGTIIPQFLTGNRANDRLGTALAPLGDMNDNGCPDFAVSAPGSMKGRPGSGRVLIIDGKKLRVFKNFKAPPYESNLGFSLAPAGDLDNDGITDLLCASMHIDQAGSARRERVYAFSSKNLLPLYFIDAPKRGEDFGQCMAGIHDIDGDNAPELMISAPQHAGPLGAKQGCVYICSGKTGKIITRLVGERAGDLFGQAIGFIPDVDGDSRREIVISARSHRKGRLYILGSAMMLPLGILDPVEGWSRFGQAFSGLPKGQESTLFLAVGSRQSQAAEQPQYGQVIAFTRDLPVKNTMDFPCGLAFMAPEFEKMETVEQAPEQLTGEQALLLNATLPGETLFLFKTQFGESEKESPLPLHEETSLEREAARHFVFFPMRALKPEEVVLWLKLFWKKRTWPKLPVAVGFAFSMQYVEDGKVLTRRIWCQP